jgi:hypothetical protein
MTQETSEIEVIKLFAPYTIWEDKTGTQHSAESLLSLTASQKQDLGIYDVAYGASEDDRFYTNTQNAPEFDSEEKIVKITYTSTAKPLNDSGEGAEKVVGLKSQYIAQFKDTANKLLAGSDWMLVRKIERNVDIPAKTATYRAAVIAEATRLETAITATRAITTFITAVNSVNWPTAE